MYVAYSSLAAAMILVGLNIPVGKMLLADFPVFTFTFIRGLIGIAVLFPLIMLRERGRVPRPEGKGIKAVILQAFLGVFLFNLFILWGLERTSSINAGIITSTIPAAVALLGFLFFRERLSVRAVGIILLAVAGVMMVNLGGGGSSDGSSLAGNLFVVGAVLAEGLFVILAKRASSHLSPLVATAWLNLAATIMFAPMALYEMGSIDFAAISLQAWALLVYYAMTASVICYFLWFFGSARVPVSQSGLFTAVLPISAVLGGAVFLGEQLTSLHLAGISATIMAIFLGVLGSRSQEMAKEKAG